MKQAMFDLATVQKKIENGEKLILAGDEELLRQLPDGAWIAGTIPYFMSEKGGSFTKNEIYVTELTNDILSAQTKSYSIETLPQIYLDAPKNGFSVIILPAFSEIHKFFALKSPSFEKFANSPLIGWVSGISLDDLGKATPKTFKGIQTHENEAVVFHVELPPNKVADIQLVNIFDQGNGDTIKFPEDGFSAQEAIVNGERVNFATYIEQNQIDIKLPLVADVYGAHINTSFQNVDTDAKRVDFYAPVFSGIEYKIASPVANYISEFTSTVPASLGESIFFSCNCILNYLYADLEGKKLNDITGPITFGEVAYQLLNQTMTYLVIEDLN